MDRKIRIGAVSYLNTKPLLYGFEKGLLSRETTLSTN
ncbi:MAG: ABC transporter substrate-binding protein, partial [Chitinophagaceae bacterium]|nr:ABC transporter substrate-binding protein [Chitinophagaceae bacterium]